MRDLKTQLTSGKNTNNLKSTKGKMFGYQVLGFGSGGTPYVPYDINFLVVGGGAAGGTNFNCGTGGQGGSGIVIIRYKFQ